MNNIDMIKEKVVVAEDMARKVWLAGLGAYGKSYEEAKGRFESLSTESNKMFTDLVKKGEKLETEGKGKFDAARTKITAKTDIEGRVESLRSILGFTATEEDQQIEVLAAKIDALTEAVAKIAAK